MNETIGNQNGMYDEVKYSLQGTTRRPRNGGC